MGQYRNGYFTSAGAAVNLNLGFIPDKFQTINYTKSEAASGIDRTWWINNVVPSGRVLVSTLTAGAPVISEKASNGVTPVESGALWYNTNYTITGVTKANPAVVTLSSLTPTGGYTLVNGCTITISNVGGMIELNQNRYIVAQVGVAGATKFALYDLYGNAVNSSAFTTYTSGGIVNLISFPATAPTVSATTGLITAQGNPAGNLYDMGYEGLTLGTEVVGSSNDVIFWEAFLETPTGY